MRIKDLEKEVADMPREDLEAMLLDVVLTMFPANRKGVLDMENEWSSDTLEELSAAVTPLVYTYDETTQTYKEK